MAHPQVFLKSTLEPYPRTRRLGELFADLFIPFTRYLASSPYIPFQSSLHSTLDALSKASDYVFENPYNRASKELDIERREKVIREVEYVMVRDAGREWMRRADETRGRVEQLKERVVELEDELQHFSTRESSMAPEESEDNTDRIEELELRVKELEQLVDEQASLIHRYIQENAGLHQQLAKSGERQDPEVNTQLVTPPMSATESLATSLLITPQPSVILSHPATRVIKSEDDETVPHLHQVLQYSENDTDNALHIHQATQDTEQRGLGYHVEARTMTPTPGEALDEEAFADAVDTEHPSGEESPAPVGKDIMDHHSAPDVEPLTDNESLPVVVADTSADVPADVDHPSSEPTVDVEVPPSTDDAATTEETPIVVDHPTSEAEEPTSATVPAEEAPIVAAAADDDVDHPTLAPAEEHLSASAPNEEAPIVAAAADNATSAPAEEHLSASAPTEEAPIVAAAADATSPSVEEPVVESSTDNLPVGDKEVEPVEHPSAADAVDHVTSAQTDEADQPLSTHEAATNLEGEEVDHSPSAPIVDGENVHVSLPVAADKEVEPAEDGIPLSPVSNDAVTIMDTTEHGAHQDEEQSDLKPDYAPTIPDEDLSPIIEGDVQKAGVPTDSAAEEEHGPQPTFEEIMSYLEQPRPESNVEAAPVEEVTPVPIPSQEGYVIEETRPSSSTADITPISATTTPEKNHLRQRTTSEYSHSGSTNSGASAKKQRKSVLGNMFRHEDDTNGTEKDKRTRVLSSSSIGRKSSSRIPSFHLGRHHHHHEDDEKESSTGGSPSRPGLTPHKHHSSKFETYVIDPLERTGHNIVKKGRDVLHLKEGSKEHKEKIALGKDRV